MRPTFSHNKSLPYHLLLYTILLLHLFSTYCDDSTTLFQGTLPSTVKIPAFPLNPGVTKSLTFTLSGIVDKLTISFVEDTYEIDSYLLTIKNNALPDTTQSTTFNATENLTISLNTKTNLLVIQGDINFRLSKIVREKSYSIQVAQELVQTDNTTSQDLQNLGSQTGQTSSKGNSSYYILAGVLGGLIGIIVVVKIGLYLKNRYKNRKHKRSSKKKPSNAREVHPDIPSPTPVFMLEDHSPEIFQKGSINLDDKGMSDNDIDVVHQHMVNHKKEILSSLGSIEYGMSKTTAVSSSTSNVSSGLVASNGSIPSVARDLESSRIKRPEPPSKKGTRLESITEEPSFLKPTAPAADSDRKEREEIKTKVVVEGSHHIPQKPKAGLKLPKLVIENKAKSHHGGYLEPPEQASKVDSPQKPVTEGDIQKLVNRVMLEKMRSNDSVEVSDSEEEEEQDLRPEPANFFCCMVCKAEKRSTVVEPCGHIFACEKCVRKIVANSKGCQLCSRRVKSYQNMKNN